MAVFLMAFSTRMVVFIAALFVSLVLLEFDAVHAGGEDDDSASFDNEMSPEETQRVLIKVFYKIDTNLDNELDETELTEWAKRVNTHAVKKNTDQQWTEFSLDTDEKLTWELYKEVAFGIDTADGDGDDNPTDRALIARLSARDHRKWRVADEDDDGLLSATEFAAFLHPESFPHMQDAVLALTIDDLDTNKDGCVNEQEFIGGLVSENQEGGDEGLNAAAIDPDWLNQQRIQFREVFDIDHNGVLDTEEVRIWLDPAGYSPFVAEAKHVLHLCDANHDDTLNIGEVLVRPNAFTQTMLVDYGNALHYHDEL